MACSVIRSPARLCNRDGKLCCYGRLEFDFLAFFLCLASRLEYDFLGFVLCLDCYFCHSLFIIPACLQYLLRVPSSVQRSPSVTTLTKYVVM